MSLKREPAQARLFSDVLRLLFGAVIVLSAISPLVMIPAVTPPWRDLLGRVIAVLASQLVAVALLRQLVPAPLPGLHRVGFHGAYLRWLLSSTLSEVALRGVIRAPFWFLHSTRCLYLRALGANLAWRLTIPSDVVLRDPALITIGSGAQLESGVRLEPALHGVGRVQIGRIEIGDGCLIGAAAMVMPGAIIAHEARLGPGAYVGPNARIGLGASIGARAVLGERVEVSSYAVVGAGAVLSDGVRVADRARILPGAVVPPDTVVGEREIFPASPAPWENLQLTANS